MINAIGLYCGTDVPSPGLAPKDKRYDPIVAAGLAALTMAVERCALANPPNTAIIGVTDRGCTAHVAKVTAGIAEHRPRQAFFVRAGAQTIATYAAMALDCHGPALTLSGATVVATTAWQIARRFMAAGAAQEVILLGADRIGERLVAAAFLLSAGNGAEDPFARFREDRVAHESPSPVLCLYAAASALAKDMQ